MNIKLTIQSPHCIYTVSYESNYVFLVVARLVILDNDDDVDSKKLDMPLYKSDLFFELGMLKFCAAALARSFNKLAAAPAASAPSANGDVTDGIEPSAAPPPLTRAEELAPVPNDA
jgi:hypothetical protein